MSRKTARAPTTTGIATIHPEPWRGPCGFGSLWEQILNDRTGSSRAAVYHPCAMSRRAGTAVVLALLISAVPTIVSLCALRCVAAEIAPASSAAPACAGHGAEKESQPSPSGHHDCSGHVLLAKGGATGAALRLDLATVVAPPTSPFVAAFDQNPERVIFESADLSPPSRRSSDILRL